MPNTATPGDYAAPVVEAAETEGVMFICTPEGLKEVEHLVDDSTAYEIGLASWRKFEAAKAAKVAESQTA